MTVRRNDRRRRLMAEEYVSTFVETDQSTTGEGSALANAETAKRAYAFGADRRSQLKTTDLFPKQLWVIVLCGTILFGIIIGLNLLNAYAPQWAPYIGDASVQAIALRGPGTLSSWMLSVMLLLTGLASLQIFALRKHRCDDYGGTYRVWLIVPPIFFVASIAAIVDFEAIIYHLVAFAKLTADANASLIPMTIKLSLVAMIMVRMLFEMRDSKAAFSMLVVAWIAVAISTVLNTQWAEQRIDSQDLAIAYPNAVLVATISLMMTHLLYVRFVYLHAHGAIAVKHPALAAKRKTKTKSVPALKKTVAQPSLKKDSAKTKPSKRTPKKEKPTKEKPGTPSETAKQPDVKTHTKPAPLKMAPVPSVQTPAVQTQPSAATKSKPTTMSDFQTLLKRKQAEKEAAAASVSPSAGDDQQNDGAILNMTKAQRRRARKAAKAKRRAA